MVVDFNEYRALKAELAERGISIHLTDACGGQYFNLDDPDEEKQAVVSEVFSAHGIPVSFTIGGAQFMSRNE